MDMVPEMQFFSKFAKDKYKTILDILRNFLAVTAVSALLVPAWPGRAQRPADPLRLNTVVIDPGHGGKDAGCTSPGGKTLEKEIVLDIATRLAGKIRDGYPDVKVVMTRSTDVFVTLQGRADIANRSGANLFISVHVNSADRKRSGPNGYSVHILGQYTSKQKDLYAGNMDVVRRENSVILLEDDYTTRYQGFDPTDPESYIFMNLMQNAFLEQSLLFAQEVDSAMRGGAIRQSRGISQDPFYVLWRTAMPAVLVECGFMSNPADRGALITEQGRERIAADLYDAFKKYKKGYDGGGPTAASERPAAAAKPAEAPAHAGGGKPEAGPTAATRYGTQVLASFREMSAGDSFFKGYACEKFPVGNLYKYVVGLSDDLAEAKKKNQEIKKKFADSFLVKIENGEIFRMR